MSEKEKAIALYYEVRDGFRYDPFDIRLDIKDMRPSLLLKRRRGHCIDKAVFLVSCLRIAEIPAKLGMARVKNHLGTARFEEALKTDILVPHGYTDVFLEGKWVK